MKEQISSKPVEVIEQQPQEFVSSSILAPSYNSKTWTNPRKRPHQHDPGNLFELVSNNDLLREADNGKRFHAPKRGRPAEWPLRNSDNAAINDASRPEDHNEKRCNSSSVRPSKFQEGSMNDKVSQKPPSLYTREEQAMEQYARSQEHDHDDLDTNYDAGIELSKPSGMFRFGKAIANAFKPFTVWPGVWKDKEKERSTSPEKNILQERQARAAEAYAALKKSGFQGTQVHTHREIQATVKVKQDNIENQHSSFRDSGVDMDYGHSSYEPNPNDQLIGFTEALLVSPPLPKHRSLSPFSDTNSARRPSLNIRKPSFQGLKKVTSQVHLSPTKRQSETSQVASLEATNESSSMAITEPSLQKQPSKKDIAKHYRLSKKVSDLENKLETARRELELSMATAPPVPEVPFHLGRKPFKPGALPSLPSERCMSPQKDGLMRSASNVENIPPDDDRRRRSVVDNADIFMPGTNLQDIRELEGAKGKTRIKKASSALEMKSHTLTGVHKRLPRVPSKTPRNSPLQLKENVPPIPTAEEAVEPVGNPQPNPINKITDHTSVSHLARAPSPFLGPPASASPTRTRSKTSRRGVSPPPPSLASAKKSKAASNAHDMPVEGAASTMELDVDVDPVKPEVPEQKPRKPLVTANGGYDKSFSDPQKEEFEWDDDVF